MNKQKTIRINNGLSISINYDKETGAVSARAISKVNELHLGMYYVAECFCCGKVETVKNKKARHLCADCARTLGLGDTVFRGNANKKQRTRTTPNRGLSNFAYEYRSEIKIVDYIKYQDCMPITNRLSVLMATMLVDLILKGENTSRKIAKLSNCKPETVQAYLLIMAKAGMVWNTGETATKKSSQTGVFDAIWKVNPALVYTKI